MKGNRLNSSNDKIKFKRRILGKEVRDIYNAYVIEMTFLFPVGANLSQGPLPFLRTIYEAGIDSRGYSYQVLPNPTGGYIVLFYFIVCASQLNRVQPLLGCPGKLSGTLDLYPGLPLIAALYPTPSSVTVSIAIEEALIFKTKCSPSLKLRQNIFRRITGAGFTISTVAILQNNIVITATPRNITASNDGKLLIGAVLPIIGIHCFREEKRRHSK